PLAVHAIAHAINAALGAIGRTVEFRESVVAPGGTLRELAQALNGGQVDTLLILEGNPVYDAPADLNWAETQRRARVVVRLGAYVDETSRVADWHIPAAHYLESWGDARTSDGTLVAVQPLIRPLFGGLSDIEVLARFAGEPETQGYQIVRATFRALTNQTSEDAWE